MFYKGRRREEKGGNGVSRGVGRGNGGGDGGGSARRPLITVWRVDFRFLSIVRNSEKIGAC